MADTDVAYAAIDRDSGERFQSLRRELGVSSFGMNLIVLAPGERGRIHHEGRDGLAWASWEDDSPGRPPQEIPLPEDLPSS